MWQQNVACQLKSPFAGEGRQGGVSGQTKARSCPHFTRKSLVAFWSKIIPMQWEKSIMHFLYSGSKSVGLQVHSLLALYVSYIIYSNTYLIFIFNPMRHMEWVCPIDLEPLSKKTLCSSPIKYWKKSIVHSCQFWCKYFLDGFFEVYNSNSVQFGSLKLCFRLESQFDFGAIFLVFKLILALCHIILL